MKYTPEQQVWADRIKAIDREIVPLDKEANQLRRLLRRSLCPLKIGDVITWRDGKFKGRVIDVFPYVGDDSFRLQVIRILKDGSEGIETSVDPYQNPVKLRFRDDSPNKDNN